LGWESHFYWTQSLTTLWMIIIAFLWKAYRSVTNVWKWLPSTTVLSAAVLTQTYSKLSSFHLRNVATTPWISYRRVVQEFLSGKDVFASLPTSYSKPLCDAHLPHAFDCMRGRKGSIVIFVAVDVIDDWPESQVCTKGAIGRVCWRDAVWPTRPGQHLWKQGAVTVYKSRVHSFKSPVARYTLYCHWDNWTTFVVDEAHCVKKRVS